MKSTLIKKKKKKKNHEKIKTLAFLRFVSICSQIRGRQSANTTLIKKKKGRKKKHEKNDREKKWRFRRKVTRERGREREREKAAAIDCKKERRKKKERWWGIPWGSERARDFHSLNWSRGRHWPLALHRIRKKKQSKTPLAPCISASALVAHYLTRNCFLTFFLLLRRERKKKPRNGCNRWWLHRDVKE